MSFAGEHRSLVVNHLRFLICHFGLDALPAVLIKSGGINHPSQLHAVLLELLFSETKAPVLKNTPRPFGPFPFPIARDQVTALL